MNRHHYGTPPGGIDKMYSLKVDNLTYRTDPEQLEDLFRKYGQVGDVYIPRDRYNKESRGFAFVRFYERDDAEDAKDALDASMFDGRQLRVSHAKYPRPSNPAPRGERSSRSNNRDRDRDRDRDRRGGGYRRSRSRTPPRRRYSRSRSRSRSAGRRRSRRSPSRSESSRSRSRSRSSSRY